TRLFAATLINCGLLAAGTANAQKQGPTANASTQKPAAKPAAKPETTSSAPKPAPDVLATVNGDKITKAQVAEDLIADQTSRLSTIRQVFIDMQRQVAGAVVGAAM